MESKDDAQGSMHLRVVRPFLWQQFLYRLPDPEPHGFSLHVAGSKTLIGPHGRFNVGCIAKLLYELIGGAVDVEVGGHLALPAAALIMAARCF